jgi:Disulphide bond corrector protein DsbC
MRMGRGLAVALAVLALCGGTAKHIVAQDFGNFDAKPKTQEFIVYAAEQQIAVAGRQSVLELNFRVLDGLHVNSHTPKSELLIPTTLTLDAAPGVKVGTAVYPAGSAYSFSASPGEKMDVYTGGFTVKVPVTAQAGTRTLEGRLKYQACDHAACYPPKTLPVEVAIAVK